MPLIDLIELYGAAAETRQMTEADAAKALCVASEGGLTLLGATDLIRNWRTARDDYKRAARPT